MPPKLAIPPRRAPVIVTASSPSELSKATVGLDSKTLLVFQDLDGSKDESQSEYIIADNIAKLVIHDVSNLSIVANGGVVTTVEVHNATYLDLRLSSRPSTRATSVEDAEPGSNTATETAKYGLLSLDPSLHEVRIEYSSADLVGAIVIASPLDQVARDIRNVSLGVDQGDRIELADDTGLSSQLFDNKAGSQDSAQHHVRYESGRWAVKGLERKEKDYPVFGS